MTQIDQFESIFRAASKSLFEYSDWELKKVLTISDSTHEQARQTQEQIRNFLNQAMDVEPVEWVTLEGQNFQTVKQLIDTVDGIQPDLICCRRNLHVEADEYPYSLGVYVEVLTQATNIPVLLIPTIDDRNQSWHEASNQVMAITDHLDDDALIVNSAIKMTSSDGKLYLAHIEDERAFKRFMHVVEKIAEIDSEMAEEKIKERLLLDPLNFIESCRTEIEKQGLSITVEPIVKMGNSLADYKKIVESNPVDLIVLHTKDNDQLAMHGLAYPLTVELHHFPMLLI